MAGSDAIEMGLTTEDRIRPRTKKPVEPALMDQIMKVCPGVIITGPDEDQAGLPNILHPVWGPNTWYPLHAHKQREVYGVMGGGAATWMRGAEPEIDRASDEIIYHSSDIPHGIQAHDEPLIRLRLLA